MAKKTSLTQPLEKWLETQVLRQDAGALAPLPATRALGERFGVSHGTAFRLLSRLEKEGRVWRHANGRFYPALAGRVLGRAKPLAVLLRRMQVWSSLCREVMEGFTDECGERDRPILWFPNKNLLTQETSGGGVRIASAPVQRTLLEEFRLFHGETVGGILFDEVWRDDAIRGVFPAGMPLLSFSRPSRLPGVGGVVADFRAGALLAISHLLASGFEKIVLIDPLPDYEPATVFLGIAREVYRELAGMDLPKTQVVTLHETSRRKNFLRKLAGTKTRLGLICPEDNVSLALAAELRAAGAGVARRHGLVSVMGTSLLAPGDLTCVRYDFPAMGRAAAAMLCEGKMAVRSFPPRLDVGASTMG
jgi:hypothetical protein